MNKVPLQRNGMAAILKKEKNYKILVLQNNASGIKDDIYQNAQCVRFDNCVRKLGKSQL